MICPHCNANLRRRDRPERRCSKCAKEFALEPKQAPLQLHDLRVRALTERLAAGRDLSATITQLRYAAARRRLPSLDRRAETAGGIWVGLTAVCSYVLFILSITGVIGPPFWMVILGGVIVGFAGSAVISRCRPLLRPGTRIAVPVTAGEFRTEVIDRWVEVYGDYPPGTVDENQVAIPVVERPRIALVCDDLSVRACLAANGVSRTHELALVDRIEHAPAGIPLLLLHDASLRGFAIAKAARLAAGHRVRALGLAPRAVMDNAAAIRLHERPPAADRISFLRTVGLTQREIDWLAAGWWSPIAAIPPARLLAVVTRAVEQWEDKADPERADARQLGFLSWPAA